MTADLICCFIGALNFGKCLVFGFWQLYNLFARMKWFNMSTNMVRITYLEINKD